MPAAGRTKSTDNTQAGLARRLHVHRLSLASWSKLDGAPKEWDFDKWVAFIKERGLGRARSPLADDDKAELQKEKLRGEIRLNQLRIAKEERSSVDRSEVDALLLHVGTMQKTVLFPALERELPPRAEGRSAAEISVLGREIADRICEVFMQSIESWKNRP